MSNRYLYGVALVATLLGAPCAFTQDSSVKSRTLDDSIVNLSPFEVHGDDAESYQATNAQSATRMDIPLKDVPFNLQVVTREFLEDTLSFGGEALGFGGGANREAVSWMGSVEGKSVRGFNTREFLRNGFLRYADNGSATIERIEVVKGPTSVLDGVTSPGGVINVITKKPNSLHDFSRFKLVLGSPLDRQVANIDINKRLLYHENGDPFVTLRLVGGVERSGYLSEYRNRELENVMPSVLFQFSDRTLLGFQHEYYHVNGERGNEIRGFTNTNRVNDASGLHGDVPLAYFYDGVGVHDAWDGPDYSTPEHVNDTLASFQHRFSDDLAVNIDYNIHNRQVNWGPLSFRDGVVQVDGEPSWRRSWRRTNREQQVDGLRANLAYKLQLEGSTHNFVLGFLKQDDYNPIANDVYADGDGNQIVEYVPILDPNPNLSITPPSSFILGPLDINQTLTQSLYINHHAKWMDGKVVTLWGLYNAEIETDSRQFNIDDLTPTRDPIVYDTSKLMPQVGVTYSVTQDVGVYVNYSQSMQGNPGRLDGFDNPFGPTPGAIREIGSKFDILDKKLNGTVSLYEIVEQNRIVNDPEAPNKDNPSGDPNFDRGANVAVGELTSKGFDADLYYYPVKNFSTVFSYGYTEVEVSSDPNPSKVGERQNGFNHKFGLFNRYVWSDGPLAGLSVNAGAQWRGKNQRTANRFGAPAYEKAMWRLQAGLGYSFEVNEVSYKLRLSAKNLLGLNERSSGYVPGTRDAYYLEYPEEYVFSLDVEF